MAEGVLTGQGATELQRPEEVPWSLLGDDVIQSWGRTEDGEFEGQHVEVTGQSGSGKSYAISALLHMRALARDSATVYIATKLDDSTVTRLEALGWPRVGSFAEVKRHKQCIFWPETHLLGEEREAWFEKRIYDLLSRLWVKDSNTVVVFDEIGYVEGLSRRLRKLIRQYWREARALGISVLASKQRPVGVSRDQHSESRWKLVFPPADEGDMQRFAELLGLPREWEPVLRSLDQEQHQFVIRNNVLKRAFITWIDFPLEALRPLPKQERHTIYQQDNTAA